MRIQPIFFASPVYYAQDEFMADAGAMETLIRKSLPAGAECQPSITLYTQAEVDAYLASGHAVSPLLVVMSGATQRWVLSVAKAAKQSLLWWYFPGDGLFDAATERLIGKIAAKNALPAVMDCWAHLRNRQVDLEKIFDEDSLRQQLQRLAALAKIRATRLLIIGYTQQWVVSASVDERKLEDRLGIQSVHIGLEELFAEYGKIPQDETVRAFVGKYLQTATACREPSPQQVGDAYRLYLALKVLLERYAANALAISCFSLVKQLGVTSCLALSLLNDDPRFVAACEGDLDAAVSMAVGKAVAGRPVFMGNPVYHLNDTLDIVHCTAPRKLNGEADLPYTVRSHHETGVSVAQRIEAPTPLTATVFRIGNEFSEATLFAAELISNPDEDTCRTQFRFRIDSTQKRLAESLGCHHLVIFGDYVDELRAVLSGPLGIRIR